MRVLIIADDLTGALDSTVAFTGAGLRCVVARRPGDVAQALAERPDVLGVNTASREGGVGAAREAIAAALDAVGFLPELIFKKVDSRLKGHVAAEVAVLAARSGRTRALFAPAVPLQGRVVVGGKLTGTGVVAPVDVAAVLSGSGIALDVPDTVTDSDLDRALSRSLDGPPRLLVGAAGLAAALARALSVGAWAVPSPRLRAPLLLAVGSHDPITVAQVDRLAASGKASVSAAPDGTCERVAGGAVRLLRLVPSVERPFDAVTAGGRFAEGIAQLVRAGDVRTLLGCGGETADAILAAMGVGILSIEGEVLPGVPASSILLDGRRLQVVTKSGGFGGEDALVAVVAAAAGPQEGAL